MDTRQFELGLQQLQAKDYVEAIATFTEVINIQPHRAEAYCQRGIAKYRSGNIYAAVDDYTQALKIDPKHAQTYYCRALARLDLENLPGTLSDANAALQFNDQYAAAYQLRAIVHRKQGRTSNAIADFESAARLYSEQDQPDQARQCQAKIAQLRPLAPTPLPPEESNTPALWREQEYFAQIIDLAQQGQVQKALDEIRWVLQVSPQDGKAYCCRGLVHCQQNRFQEAIADFNQAIVCTYAQAITYRNRGYARLQLGDVQGAIADCTQAIGLEPAGAENYIARGNAYRAMEHWMGAIEDYEEALSHNPNQGQAFFQRGQTYAQMENQAQAIADYQKAIAIFCNQEEWKSYQQAITRLRSLQNTAVDPNIAQSPAPQILYDQLYQHLLELLDNNRKAVDGMIRQVQSHYPGRSAEWYLETIIQDIENYS
jgi:tetratricopeptide (TPR) repeat protein